MKYIKNFELESDYQDYLEGSEYLKPNVSWSKDENIVHYDKKTLPTETRIVATFRNDTAFNAPTKIVGYVAGREPYYVISPIDNIERNGETIDMGRFNGTVIISANSENTYMYTLKDITEIADNQFITCNSMTSVIIPSCIESIGTMAFSECTSLQEIVCKAETPPTITASTFSDTNNCPIYVPADSITAYTSANGWSDLSSRITQIIE